MKKRYVPIILMIVLIIILMILLIFILNLEYSGNSLNNYRQDDPYSRLTPIVSRVIDGDTFVMQTGEVIRLICIDSPELGLDGSFEAKQYLESMILETKVILEKDFSDTDKYHRLLRYAYVIDNKGNKIFVNKEMVKTNHATIFMVPPDTTKCSEIKG